MKKRKVKNLFFIAFLLWLLGVLACSIFGLPAPRGPSLCMFVD